MKVTVTLCLVLICSLSQITTAVAETIDCASGDVQCLIAAIHQANADPRKTTIRLAGGTYLLTSVDNVTDGQNGLPSIVSPVTLKSGGGDATLERMRTVQTPTFRFLHVGPTGQLTLDGITLTGGAAGGLIDEDGGALLIRGGGVTIINSSLRQNTAFGVGGAISNRQGTLTIVDSTIEGNGTTAADGGGIKNATGLVTLTRTVIDGNGAVSSGGLSSVGGEVRITESVFTNNFGEFSGGAIHLSNGARAEIAQTTFARNSSEQRGTAIFIDTQSDLVLRDSAVVGSTNVSFPGETGAIFNQGTLQIINTTVARNITLDQSCSGIAAVNEGTMTLVNSTFTENRAPGCVAAPVLESRSGSTTRLQNTIIVHNSDDDLSVQDCQGLITSLGNNFIGNPAGCGITLQLSDLTGDAELGTFTDEGTPGNPHYSPLPLSPVIDAGNNSACPKTDQIGQPRKPRCDIGAVEFR